jgi:DNA transposition AAA+ family ATPase
VLVTLQDLLIWTAQTRVADDSLPVADALTDVVNTIAYAVHNATSQLASTCDVALDLLAEPVITHFVRDSCWICEIVDETKSSIEFRKTTGTNQVLRSMIYVDTAEHACLSKF